MRMLDELIHAREDPFVKAWLLINVLFIPLPPVAPASLHNAAPVSA